MNFIFNEPNFEEMKDMETASITLFVLFGIVMPILIGGLHTYVHFKELGTKEVQDKLNNVIPIMGKSKNIFNAWGLMSFMMGASFIIIGLLNISILTISPDTPPIPAIIAIILYLACSIYVGRTYKAAPQFYGGIVGIIGMLTCLGLTIIS